MNPLQLNQILPQSAQSTNLAFAQKISDTSFSDALKAAQSELDSRESQRQVENSKSKEISRQSESKDSESFDSKSFDSESNSKVAESSDYGKKSESSESKSDKISEAIKSEKKTANSDSENQGEKSKKSDEKEIALGEKNAAENLPLENAAAENLLSSNKENFLKNQKNLEDSEKSFENGEIFESKNSKKISAAELSWLSKPGKTEKIDASNENFANAENADDFASLIDAAIDFIPGSESEAERLAGAQNLSISDPEAFLAKVHELSDAEIGAKKGIGDEKTESQKSKKSGLKFDVHDLRASKSQNQAEQAKSAQKLALKKEANLEIASSIEQKNDTAVQLTMKMAGNAETNITSSSNQAAGANSSVFQAMLSNAVQENASDIVKAGNIVLKDNNQGSINLILKPEALGNVKISLNLNDKVISGQINVQTREALEAFRESIDSLKQAFTESGFETGSFDLNFSSGQNFAQNSGNGENQSASYFAEKAYGDFVSSSADAGGRGESVFSEQNSKEYSVNIVA